MSENSMMPGCICQTGKIMTTLSHLEMQRKNGLAVHASGEAM